MIRRNKDVINKGNELTGIRENVEDIEINQEMQELINKANLIKKTSHLRRQAVEKEAIYALMTEKGNPKRYLISQKWLVKWE